MRQNQPRTFADETEAEDAFDMEVIASLTDPIIIDMQRRGVLISCKQGMTLPNVMVTAPLR